MAQLQLNLLGGFTVMLDQQPVTKFRSAKARALLAYLAAQPEREHPRTTLATLFWGDLPESTAKTNLRIELSNLHKTLADHPALVIERNSVCFHPVAATVDLLGFQRTLTTLRSLPVERQRTQLAEFAAAVALYQGEFLSGFTVADAPGFDEWRVLTQEQLHEQVMGALTQLQQGYAEAADWGSLATVARRQLALAPWQESAHRALIQALAAQGQREAALEQYERCTALLRAELGVEPTPATQALAERLRSNGTKPTVTAPPPHNLPQQAKTLVGRKAEIQQIEGLVQQERLVTLLGLGGVGKSRLALAVAQKALPDFADGVWFVPLAAIEATPDAADRIALAMAAAMGFPLTNAQQPLAELAAHLANKEILFVLDNWDHLIAAAEALCERLLASQAVHLLVTSRVRLGVEGERFVPIDGLPPQAAFTLFVERARQVVPTFAAEAQRAEIDQLCAQVAGLPLGIELAASWVEHFTVAEISRSLTAIEPEQAAAYTNRHQTLDNLFEYSWRLLSPAQQQILARLSAFRGGFDRAAAGAVAGSTLSDLSVLLAHSLLQRVGAGRYELHPLIQEFSARKIELAAQAALFADHSTHYLTLLAQADATQRTALQVEVENLRSAWQRSVAANAPDRLAKSVAAFGEFMAQFGLMTDGNTLFAEAVNQFTDQPDQAELVACLLDQQSLFARRLYGLPITETFQLRVLALSQDPKLRVNAHTELANLYGEQGKWREVEWHFDQAEEIAQAAGDLATYVMLVEARIHINATYFRGDFRAGMARLEELLGLLAENTIPSVEAEDLRFRIWQSLPILAIRYRDYGAAIRYAQQALTLAQQIAHRHRECNILLDLALAEQFAGLYEQAVAHNRAALAIAEAIGDADEIALLNANLCLTLRQMGQLEAALTYGTTAVASLRVLGNRRMEGQARNRVGHTLLALGQWAAAARAYEEALAVWAHTQHPNRYEAVAGRAVALVHLGQPAEGVALVQEVLSFVETHDLVGIVEPVLLLLNCATVLCGAGATTQATAALQRAATWVELVTDRISDEAVSDAFLHRPDVRQLYSLARRI